jgi:macrolide transport system ATP-binding/permease protein
MMNVPQLRGHLVRFFGLFLRARREREFAEELESHLAMHIEDNLRAGMSPEEARRQALIKLGGVTLTQELHREQGGLPMLETFLQDLRFGLRTLRKNPAFTFIAILTLSLGIGVNAAIFSLVDGVLLRPLRYANADQLVRIWSADQKAGLRFLETSYQDFEQFKQQASAFAAMAALSEANFILRDDRHEPINITVARVSEGFFPVFGVAPQLGRDFLAEEYTQGARMVMLSHRLWQQRYASSPAIIGQTVTIDGAPHTVVGVTPEDYDYPRRADLWVPLTKTQREDDDPEFSIIARLATGATLAQGTAEVSAIARRGCRRCRRW